MTPPPAETAIRALIEANGFEPTALDANRAGRLTPAQAQRLRGKRRGRGAALLVFGALCIGFGGWDLATTDGGHSDAVGALVLGVILIAMRWSNFGQSYAAQIAAGRVAWVDGPIRIRSITGDSHEAYWYEVAGREFQTTEEGAKAIVEKLRYRVYHVPDSDLMVNIEPLP
jgi:hypothetical protein